MLSRSTKSNAHQNLTTTWNSGAIIHKITYRYFEPVCFIKSMKTHACKYWWNHNFFYQNVILCIRPKTAILILQSGNILKKQLKKYAECNVPHLSGPVGFTFSVIHVGWTLRAAMIFRPFLTERYMALCSLTTEGPPTPLTDYCFWNKHEHFENLQEQRPLIWIIYIFKEAILYKNYLIT